MNNSPQSKLFAKLPHSFAIQLTGADAAKVINNLSTNDINKLAVGATCETFITDARGWVVAHAGVLKGENQAWLLGCHPAPSLIANHLERYIIREAAVVKDHSADFTLFVLSCDMLNDDMLNDDTADQAESHTSDSTGAGSTLSDIPSVPDAVYGAGISESAFSCQLPVWGPASRVIACPRRLVDEWLSRLHGQRFEQCGEEQFEWLRVSGFWPLHAADIGDKTIPQELDRDPHAISFTKGCYLGQETIARLDARGQLQKKLCLVELEAGGQYAAGDTVQNGDKDVGKITSLARDPFSAQVRALGYLRRGNFDAHTQLHCHGFSVSVLR